MVSGSAKWVVEFCVEWNNLTETVVCIVVAIDDVERSALLLAVVDIIAGTFDVTRLAGSVDLIFVGPVELELEWPKSGSNSLMINMRYTTSTMSSEKAIELVRANPTFLPFSLIPSSRGACAD